MIQKIIINNEIYEEHEGKTCQPCAIEWLSTTCRKLNCCAKNRPDGRDVYFVKVGKAGDPIAKTAEPSLF